MTHPSEAANRYRKARKLADVLGRAGADAGAPITDEQWQMAAEVAGMKAPSDATKSVVAAMLAENGKPAPADPFEGLTEEDQPGSPSYRSRGLGDPGEATSRTRYGPDPVTDLIMGEVDDEMRPCERCGSEPEILGARLCLECDRKDPPLERVATRHGSREHLRLGNRTLCGCEAYGLRSLYALSDAKPCGGCLDIAQARGLRLPRTWNVREAV